MISASTQALAALIASNPLGIEPEEISFAHPLKACEQKPCLSLYCYNIEAIEREFKLGTHRDCQWFELKFVLSVFDHTTLGEQHLLSALMSGLSNCRSVPEPMLAPKLRGWGDLPLQVSTPAAEDSLRLWKVLGAPIRLSLHLTLAVPMGCHKTLVPA